MFDSTTFCIMLMKFSYQLSQSVKYGRYRELFDRYEILISQMTKDHITCT